MKEKKKEKRYFVDWCDYINKSSKLGACFFGIILPIIVIIVCVGITYKIYMPDNANMLNSYPAEIYERLEEIATITIKEGHIDYDALFLLDDVATFNISGDKSINSNIVYTYSLNVNDDIPITPSMTITLSKNKILSKSSVYSSKETYTNYLRSFYLGGYIIPVGGCLGIVILVIALVIVFIACFISKAHKKRDSKIDSSDIDNLLWKMKRGK